MVSDLIYRPFVEEDKAFCFHTRKSAFEEIFVHEVGKYVAAAGGESVSADDFLVLAHRMHLFVICERHRSVGFITLNKPSASEVEILHFYVDLSHLGQGIGKKSMEFIETWIRTNWPDVKLLFLHTIIPKYNGLFYRKMGFTETGPSFCRYGDLTVPAVRFEKSLDIAVTY